MAIKKAVIKAYNTSNAEDTNVVVTLQPATGTNNKDRVDIILESITPAATISTSVNYAELLAALGVVK